MKDILKEIPFISKASKILERTIEKVCKTPEREAQYDSMAKTLNIDGKKLIRPVVTRWNSHLEAWNRILDVRKILDTMGAADFITVISESDWNIIERALFVMSPFDLATDVLQGDTSDLKQLEVNLSAIRIHIQKLETLEEFKVTAIRIRGILIKRSFHFESDCIKLYRLLEPSNNQQLLKDEERIEVYNLLKRYSKCWVERRNRQWSEEDWSILLGMFYQENPALRN